MAHALHLIENTNNTIFLSLFGSYVTPIIIYYDQSKDSITSCLTLQCFRLATVTHEDFTLKPLTQMQNV